MNIKGLLLGSAAALVAISGARAADAVMAPEPEPVEYVRVCDAYGAGFFYIPGTETCLQISGYIWYQVGASSWRNGGDTPDNLFINANGWAKNIEARVNFDARSETEWGTLRSYIRFQASWNGVGDGAVAADQAFIQLGGFTLGYTESFWADSQDGTAANYGSHSWLGMSYGYQQRALIGYTFNSNGFIGALALEDDALAGDGYVPDVVAKLGYTGGWGAVWGRLGYDEDRDGLGNDGWGAQLGAQFNIPNMPGSNLRLIAYYSDSDNSYGATFGNASFFGGFGAAEWSILASYNHQFSETFGASVAFQWFDGFYTPGTAVKNGFDGWGAELSVVWLPVTNFEVRSELHYDKLSNAGPDVYDGTVSGFLRFTRYF